MLNEKSFVYRYRTILVESLVSNLIILSISILLLQKQRKMLRDRLTSQFSDAVKNFQDVQRHAAQKERESVMRARAQSGLTGVN